LQLIFEVLVMDKKEFDSFVELKIQDIVSLTIESEHLEFEEALKYLYESELYTALLNENTKLWHLSAKKLSEMLASEKKTDKLIYPDYV
jgi:hypothetical protein